MQIRRWPILFAILVLAIPAAALAQSFGQNKVQYRKLEWAVIGTEHFDVYFYKGEREAAVDAARMAERAYQRLSTILHHKIERKIPLILYASQSDFQVTNVTPEMVSEGTGGFTDFGKRRVTIPFTGGYGDLEHVLTHELTHAFQVDVLYGPDKGVASEIGSYTPPLWFMEGMAEYLSITKVDNLTKMWLRDAALQGYLISIQDLEYAGDIRVYRFGQSIFAYIGATWGDERIGDILARVGQTHSVDRAIEDVLGMSMKKLSEDWMEDVRKTYLPEIRDYQKPEDFARRLTDSEKDLSSYHLAPAVSPNGDRMVFISDKDLYDDVYLASALDGRVEKRLVKGDRAEAFESLRFLNASIDFSPDGEEIAFSAKAGAHDAIYVQRLRDRKILNKIEIPLDGIVNPSFSPDGKWIVFTGLVGGRSDLFRCRTDGSNIERLTDDRFLDISPRYSPDGKSIVFVTDQDTTTDFQRLIFAPPRLAIFDLASRDIRVLPNMPGTNTSPYFLPDGSHILYVSDRTGIANIYIRDLATGYDARLTNILTGVTGIIPLAPALSLSRDGRRVVFSAFRQGSWDLFAIKDPLEGATFEPPIVPPAPLVAEGGVAPAATGEGAEIAAGGGPGAGAGETAPAATGGTARMAADGSTRAPDAPAPPEAPGAAGSPQVRADSALVPPEMPRRADAAAAQALDSLAAISDTARFQIARHALPPDAKNRPPREEAERPKKVGEVFASIRDLPDTTTFKVDPYRVHFTIDYAAASGFFGSNVGAAAQTVLSFSDVLGNHDLIIGADVYGSLSDSDFLFEYDNLANRVNWGISVYQFRDDFFLSTAQTNDNYVSQIYRGGSLMVSRPFDRFHRIEFDIEGLQVDQSVYQEAYLGDYVYGLTQSDHGKLYFIRPGVTYVQDNAVWGVTGPISGGRSVTTFDYAIGDIRSSRLIFDRRSYWNLHQRYTFAMRLVGATSAGRDPQDFRIGGPYTLRGYPYGDISGSHVGLVNLEFRFPLIQTLELGWPLPIGLRWIRGALFFDSGSAWQDTHRFRAFDAGPPWHLADIRASYGAGAAINIGFAVLRWDISQPTDLHRNSGKAVGTISFGGDF